MHKYSKAQIATAIAIIFHAVGLVGMLTNANLFASISWLNLLLMAGLIIYTQPQKNIPFFIFVALTFCLGIAVEIIGVNTGKLFGNYKYSSVLGISIKNVPIIIGANWFIIMYCCGMAVNHFMARLAQALPEGETIRINEKLKLASLVFDAATLAVIMDWIIEPVAIKLNYWSWLPNGDIPTFNYISWFAVSAVFMLLFNMLAFKKNNIFAVHLLLIMSLFFVILRTFLCY
jgi:bisanhydrobacterioruberin hydratase